LGNEVLLLLLLGAPLQERERIQPDVDALYDAKCGLGALDFLADQAKREIVEPRPAVLFGNWPAKETKRTHLFEGVPVDLALLVVLACVRCDLILSKVERHLLDSSLLLVE